MIGVVLKGHDYKYEVSELIKLFTSDFRFIDVRDCMMVIENSIFYHGDRLFSKTVYCENYQEILSLSLIHIFTLYGDARKGRRPNSSYRGFATSGLAASEKLGLLPFLASP